MKSMCLQAMSIVYAHHYKEIGLFSDTKYIIGMLDKVCVIDFKPLWFSYVTYVLIFVI